MAYADTHKITDRGIIEVPPHAHPHSLRPDDPVARGFRNVMTGCRYGSDSWNQAWAFYSAGWRDGRNAK